MKKLHLNIFLYCFTVLLSGLAFAKKTGNSNETLTKPAETTDSQVNSPAKKYQEILWEELIPEDELKLLLNPPESIWGIEDGSPEDSLEAITSMDDSMGGTNSNRGGAMSKEESAYFAALKSFNVVKAFDKKHIRLPGFIVPLATNEKNQVTEFFIVPYFGACLHMPPPPPNQIVFAKLDKGYELTSLYQPFWFEGQINISTYKNALGDSAYELDVDTVTAYDPFAEFEQ